MRLKRIDACSRIIVDMLTRLAGLASLVAALVAWSPTVALCQPADAAGPEQARAVTPALTAEAYTPISGMQRIDWIVDGTIGRRSLTIVGPLATAWQTAFNSPEEWGRSASGVAKRYGHREADVAISSTIEAGLGALWGEGEAFW